MANKRQRVARRHFVQTTPSSSDNTPLSISKKRKATQLEENDQHNRPKKPSSHKLRKHPLRVPGKKPGEGCFICKSVDHISKSCPQRLEKDRKKVCLLCRGVGHTLKNCPGKQHAQEIKFCYNCGEVGHRLAECKEPIKDGGTTFAECFVCKKKGHLSKNCPSNTHGIYPKGGCCKVCGGVTHLAKDCPQKHTGKPTNSGGSGRVKLKISKEAAPASQSGNNSKRIVFRSGDELEDDFVGMDNDQGTDSTTAVDEKSFLVTTRKLERQDKKKKKGQAGLSHLDAAVKKTGKGTSKVVNFFK